MSELPQPGDVLAGKYRIERVLGRGGMGAVLAAYDLDFEVHVAIKVLLGELASVPEIVERFIREGRAAHKIESKHAVKVSHVGRLATGAPFLVMELLAGEDLQQRVHRHGPLNEIEAADLVLQACEALAEAHARGIVHRDLKPANLFVTTGSDGRPFVKVLDFGISKVADGQKNLTQTRGLMGSALYMSPEQLRSAKHVDARADIWALGVTLFELLTGAHPFDAEDIPQLSVKIVLEPPRPPRALTPNLSAPIEGVVLRCLEKDPAARFQSITELAAALAPLASDAGRAHATRIATQRMDAPISIERTEVAATPIVPSMAPGMRTTGGVGAVGAWTNPERPATTVMSRRAPGTNRLVAAAGGVAAVVTLVAAFALTRATQPATPAAAPSPSPQFDSPAVGRRTAADEVESNPNIKPVMALTSGTTPSSVSVSAIAPSPVPSSIVKPSGTSGTNSTKPKTVKPASPAPESDPGVY